MRGGLLLAVSDFRATFFLVDFLLEVEVDADDDKVRDDVEGADAHEDLRVIERNLFRDLHHA